MGAFQSSRNHVNNLTETMTRIIQDNAQSCTVQGTQVEEILVKGCEHVVIRNIDLKQLASVDFTCLQRGDLNAKVASQMQVQLEQLAKSLLSGIDFRIFSMQEADNFINNHVRLATEIINRLNQFCFVNTGQYAGIKCDDSRYVVIRDIKFNQLFKAVYKCAQEGNTVADVKTEIEQFIKQTAISENKGISLGILWILLIVGIVVVAIVILNKALNWKFLAIGFPIAAIVIYLIIAAVKNWWPFHSKFDDKKRKPDPPVPRPPAPASVQQFQAEQQKKRYDQLWGQAQLGLNRLSITPEQYRQLKYGDAQIAFDSPFGRPSNTRKCAGEAKRKSVQLAMKPYEPIMV